MFDNTDNTSLGNEKFEEQPDELKGSSPVMEEKW